MTRTSLLAPSELIRESCADISSRASLTRARSAAMRLASSACPRRASCIRAEGMAPAGWPALLWPRRMSPKRKLRWQPPATLYTYVCPARCLISNVSRSPTLARSTRTTHAGSCPLGTSCMYRPLCTCWKATRCAESASCTKSPSSTGVEPGRPAQASQVLGGSATARNLPLPTQLMSTRLPAAAAASAASRTAGGVASRVLRSTSSTSSGADGSAASF
mmetsp:Transcript_275/g.734  ORF Transcript_275/g.734 Transcript_275/m.734 type:complete len:219 (+) Transcript_275:132-788(+)